MSWLLDDPSSVSIDAAAIGTAYWTNDEGTKVCRLCGVHAVLKPTVKDAASITDRSPDLISYHATRDAGCTARPQTKTQSCVTDAALSQPTTETPVKAVERTRTGLQITRKTKSHSVTTAGSTAAVTPPTTLDVPVVAAIKSPTSDVACGTDMEFHSKYFNMDDSGLLRQLCADDVAEVLRRRGPSSSSSVSSPTCDVACNTEYDSRPLTPARLNYSRYYAVAAVDPPPATAVDVACGPDTPSPSVCDVGCGTEDRESITPFQTSSDATLLPPIDPRSPGHRLTDESQLTFQGQFNAERGIPLEMVNAAVETERSVLTASKGTMTDHNSKPILQLANTTAGYDVGYEDRLPATTTSTAVGDFDVREDLVLRSRTADSSGLLGAAGQISAPSRGLTLDIGLGSAPDHTGEQTVSRQEDFNDDDEPRSDEFQTHSLGSRWTGELQGSTVPVLEVRHDVKFIDEDVDSELDGVNQAELDGRTTANITTSDEDVGSPSMAADLGRRWGTVDLIPKLTDVSPLPSPNAAPLKSIMKSPQPSSEKTLSKTKKGISFSQDTVFKESASGEESQDDDDDDRRLESEAKVVTSSRRTTPTVLVEPCDELTDACKTYALWLRDSTEVTSKQLNQSLQVIRQKWFSLTGQKTSDTIQLKSFLADLQSFSPELLKNVVNLADDNGNSALHYAMSNSHFDAVKLLLDTGMCDITRQNKTGCTVVMLASLVQISCETDRHVIKRLFQLGDINQQASLAGQTALMLASSRGREDIVEMLLEAGADVNAQDDDGSTALMCAAEHGCVNIVKMLLAHPDCDPSLQDNDGSTAMSVAMEAGNSDVGVLLYAHEERLKSASGNRRQKRKSPILKSSKS